MSLNRPPPPKKTTKLCNNDDDFVSSAADDDQFTTSRKCMERWLARKLLHWQLQLYLIAVS